MTGTICEPDGSMLTSAAELVAREANETRQPLPPLGI